MFVEKGKTIMKSELVSDADDNVRYVPEGISNFCSLAHESRYNYVIDNYDIKDKIILDFGCGSGYGSYMLSKHAKKVDAIDYSPTSIEYARSRYNNHNINYNVLNACLSEEVFRVLEQNKYDIIVTFDVIEHLDKYFDYLENIKKLLKNDGILIIGCPNRLQTFEWRKEWEKFHIQEFTPYQLRKILSFYFTNVILVGQDFRDEMVKEENKRIILKSYKRNFIKRFIPKSILFFLYKNYMKIFKKNKVNKDDTKNITFSEEPGESKLEESFGLLAICRK